MKPRNPEQTSSDSISRIAIDIVKPSPDDWMVLRDLSMRAIEQEPVAFNDPEPEKQRIIEAPESEWRRMLASENNPYASEQYIFAKDQATQKFIGMVCTIIPQGVRNLDKSASIYDLFVDREYQGQGVGRKLLEAMIEKIKSRGDITSVNLNVVTTQEPAIALYKSMGFTEEGSTQTVNRGDKEYEQIKMHLNL